MSECDSFPGRLGQICHGEVLTRSECDKYRALWGLPPLPESIGDPGNEDQKHASRKAGPVSISTESAAALVGGVTRELTKLPPHPTEGPGTELKHLLESLGLTMAGACGCPGRQGWMNTWGSVGCRQRRARIVGWMASAEQKTPWVDRLRAAQAAEGLGIDWADPHGWLVDQSILRAEAKGL